MPDIDAERRYIEARFDNTSLGNLSVISLYLHMAALKTSGREVVVCGDWNIAHKEAYLKNWKSNQKNSGFLPEERAWMTKVLRDGWVDVYRRLHPDAKDERFSDRAPLTMDYDT